MNPHITPKRISILCFFILPNNYFSFIVPFTYFYLNIFLKAKSLSNMSHNYCYLKLPGFRKAYKLRQIHLKYGF